MRAILLGPVKSSSREQARVLRSLKIRKSDLRVGVDGGCDIWKKWGMVPDFAVGDWDSLNNRDQLSQIPHLTLSTSKDRSDLFYAGKAAIQAGATELLCLGVTGGDRMDHHLATLFDLAEFSTGKFGKLKTVEAWDEKGVYHFLSEKIPSWKGSLPKGHLVSIFGMNAGAKGVTLKGFKYALKNAVLAPSSHGLSNQASGKPCGVSLRKGQLLVWVNSLHGSGKETLK